MGSTKVTAGKLEHTHSPANRPSPKQSKRNEAHIMTHADEDPTPSLPTEEAPFIASRTWK